MVYDSRHDFPIFFSFSSADRAGRGPTSWRVLLARISRSLEHCFGTPASNCPHDVLLQASIAEIFVNLLFILRYSDVATCIPYLSPSVCIHVFVVLLKFLFCTTAMFFSIVCRPMHY
jgi:hypothetical protein